MANVLLDKKIILGVCGGIAAYKALDILRLLISEGARVRVVMTVAAAHFINPQTFAVLSGEPVFTELFQEGEGCEVRHIVWAKEADALVVAPATANTIAKMSYGLADNPLTTLLLAVSCPLLVCPSMNTRMYQNAITQENLNRLKKNGIWILEPEYGAMACGEIGQGRLPASERVIEEIKKMFTIPDLKGEICLITAGPTQEPLDPARHISNRSSGKMGYALARAASRRGAKVVLISGPTSLKSPVDVELVRVRTADEMSDAVLRYFETASIILKAAAVSDYRPADIFQHKIKKTGARLVMDLVKTPDILQLLGERKEGRILVGFAAETEKIVENAKSKLKTKNLDLIVANDISLADSGFDVDTDRATLIFNNGTIEPLPLLTKDQLAGIVLDRVGEIKRLKSCNG
ncbi:MAG: bifunctional phosphopantothenoylcysteine decarboxylase/phosphopantothenate--cysteine ligase CoaBC [Pseudomonadota bacterium]